MRTVVIMEHDGSGRRPEPIAILEVGDGDQDWRVKEWMEDHGWRPYSVEGQWTKMVSGLYGGDRRFAGVSGHLTVVEAR